MAKKKTERLTADEVRTGDQDEPTFEQSLAALEEIVADLEGGQLGLGESLEAYEAGIRQLKACHRQLQAAERRVELLSGVDADGNPVTMPFDDAAMTLEEKQASRSRRRSTPPSGDVSSVDDSPGLF